MRLFPADYRLVQYSSDQVAESRTLVRVGRSSFSVAAEGRGSSAHKTHRFQVEATLRALPGIRFGIGIFGPCVSRRTREIAEADPDDFYLIINTEGVFNISQANGDVVLKEGDACLMRCSQEADLIRAVAGRLIFARFERVSVSARIPDIDDYGGQIIRIGNEALHLLTAYLRIIDGRQKLSSPQLRQSIIEHIYSLLELVLVSSRVSVQPIHNAGSGAVQMDILKRFISERLSNPQLSLAMSQLPTVFRHAMCSAFWSRADDLLEIHTAKAAATSSL